MIKLCEACYRQIAAEEPHAVLRVLFKVTAAGRPEWRELYLHHFDRAAAPCPPMARVEAA